jgi:hypothetical protein
MNPLQIISNKTVNLEKERLWIVCRNLYFEGKRLFWFHFFCLLWYHWRICRLQMKKKKFFHFCPLFAHLRIFGVKTFVLEMRFFFLSQENDDFVWFHRIWVSENDLKRSSSSDRDIFWWKNWGYYMNNKKF